MLIVIFPGIYREYLDDVPMFQGCREKLLDSISVLLREIQVVFCHPACKDGCAFSKKLVNGSSPPRNIFIAQEKLPTKCFSLFPAQWKSCRKSLIKR